MSFNVQPTLHTTPESHKARHDLIRQEFRDAQSDGNLLGEALLLLTWPLRAALRPPRWVWRRVRSESSL